MAITTHQPFKAVYALVALFFEACRLPLWILMYTLPFGRPHKNWSLRQAVGVRIVRAFLYHSSRVEMKSPLSLQPGSEKERFAVMEPGSKSLYVGPADDKVIKPVQIGGTWYPTPYTKSEAKADVEDVVLHFHGGAFVIGDGREHDAGFLCRTLVKHAGFARVFSPQYRLSSNALCRFPAQLQDAITSYSYLIHDLHIPGHRISLSGDSAGGNIVFGLLRYLEEHGQDAGLPTPACAFLWSPWVNVDGARDPKNIVKSPHYKTDYLTAGFGIWGARTFAGNLDAAGPYISPFFHPFAIKVPMFVQSGGAEVLYHEHLELEKKFGEVKGNVIELVVEPYAPHDIALVGKLTSFEKEFVECAKKAGEFFRRHKK